MTLSKKQLKSRITRALKNVLVGRRRHIEALIPESMASGKLYEAYALSRLCGYLSRYEGCTLTLIGGTKIVLKSSPGPINRAYPHIRVERDGVQLGEIWTDIEFTSLSFWAKGGAVPTLGDFHELDIALVVPTPAPRPLPNQVLLGAECKHTGYQKSLLREVLGIRRELSLVTEQQPTAFTSWPAKTVPAQPASCLLVFSSDPSVNNYSSPGGFFGITFLFEPI